jgi:hypothetical protein
MLYYLWIASIVRRLALLIAKEFAAGIAFAAPAIAACS